MSTIVVGAGAIGLLVAARLAASGHQTGLLARSNAAALAADGVVLEHEGQASTVREIAVFRDPAAPPFHPDMVVVCVKGFDLPGVLPALAALDAPFMLTLQNGIGHEQALIEAFGSQRIVSGAITISVEVQGENTIAVTKNGGIGLAPTAGQPVGVLAERFTQAGFNTRLYQNYQSMKWSKALLNMLGNATAAILDMPVAEVYADDQMVGLERRAFREALTVMDALHLKPVSLPRYPAAPLAQAMRYLPAPLLYPVLRKTVAGGRGGKLPSLLIELRKGNPRSEGRFLNGAIAENAARAGVAAPVNTTLWRTLDGIARGEIAWEPFRRNPQHLLATIANQAS